MSFIWFGHLPRGVHFVVTKVLVPVFRRSHHDVSPSVGEGASYVLPVRDKGGRDLRMAVALSTTAEVAF